jgi:hypothetical protein
MRGFRRAHTGPPTLPANREKRSLRISSVRRKRFCFRLFLVRFGA